jgi:Arc/MetJ family transcription regulator
MRTNIEIEDDLMQEAMRATGATTKRAAIELALRRLIEVDEAQKELQEVFRLQEVERQVAEHDGRLKEWNSKLTNRGNCPGDFDDANQCGD